MTGTPFKRIAINTGGGDAPGLNAVIHSAVHAAHRLGWEVLGVRGGYDGLLAPETYSDGGLMRLTPSEVKDISHLGGTILGTTNRTNPLKFPMRQPDGSMREVNRSDEIIEAFGRKSIDALIAVGGEGSLAIAQTLSERGLCVVGVPKTIDNDVLATTLTFGFDSAVSFATECIDRLHSTAAAHRRVMVVEVMGRYAGWIALNSGIAGRADAILIPEIPYHIERVAQHLKNKGSSTQPYGIVVAAEGAAPVAGGVTVKVHGEAGRADLLGGIGERLAKQLQELSGFEARSVVLGHLLRGGSPTAFDRLLGLSFGAAAVHALQEGLSGVMVAMNPPRVEFVPLKAVSAGIRRVPPDGNGVLTARTLGICFGD